MTEKETFDPSHTPVRISDAASMLRKRVEANERPFTKDIIKFNNSLVDEWHDSVLKKICNKNASVRSGQIYGEWQYFYCGKTIKNFIEYLNQGIVCRPSRGAVEYWVNIFNTLSVKELAKIGPSTVAHGWKLIIDESMIRDNLAKWENIYSLSDDPLEWRKLANNNPKLFNENGENPFWDPEEYQNITQKVMTVLKVQISPSG
jgi:hypothetical protein